MYLMKVYCKVSFVHRGNWSFDSGDYYYADYSDSKVLNVIHVYKYMDSDGFGRVHSFYVNKNDISEDRFGDYFCTGKEMRRLKLRKLNVVFNSNG